MRRRAHILDDRYAHNMYKRASSEVVNKDGRKKINSNESPSPLQW